MPETAERIAKQLNTSLRDFDQLEQFGLYESGSKVTDQPEIPVSYTHLDVYKRQWQHRSLCIKSKQNHSACRWRRYDLPGDRGRR